MPTDFETYPDRGAIRFLRPRDFGDIINVTFRFLTANLRPLLVGQLTVAGPALVLVTASLLLFGGMELFNPAGAFSGDPDEVFATLGPMVVVTGAAYVLAALLSFAAAFGVVLAYRRGELDALQGADLWDEARPTLLPLLGVIGVVLGLLVLAIPALLIPCLGALAFLAAFVYFFPALYLVYAVRLFEGGGAWASLTRAVELAKTNWARAFGTMVVGLILSYVLSLVISVPGIALSMLAGSGDGAPVAVLAAVGSVFQLAALLVSNTFFVVLTSFLHGSLKESAEGTLLDDDLERLAAGEASVSDLLDDAANPLRDAPRASDPTALERADAGGFAPPDAEPLAPEPPAPEPPAPEPPAPDAPPASGTPDDARTGRPREGGFRGGGFGS